MPKITDFGIAKKLNETRALTASGTAAGTPQYMAPEQAIAKKEHPVGGPADVYAIGVILYEMLTQRTPFEGDSPVEVMQRVVTQTPPSPTRYTPNIPRDLETIILKCLEKSPARRYATAEALADDLAAWQQGKPISARHVGRVEQTVRWCQRNPLIFGLLASIFLVLSLGIIASSIFALSARDAARSAEHERHLAREAEAEARVKEQEAKTSAEIADRNATEAQRITKIAELNADDARRAQANEAVLRQEATKREQRRGRELYAADMLLAYADGLSGQMSNTQQLLKKYRVDQADRPDQRGFEWHYINRLTMGYETVFDRMHMFDCVAVPNSTAWALVGANRLVVCDPSQQRVVERINIPTDRYDLQGAVYSPNGEYIACLLEGSELWLYHRPSAKITHKVKIHETAWDMRALQVAFAPDSKMLYAAVGNDHAISRPGRVLAIDPAKGEIKREFTGLEKPVRSLALSPDGKRLMAGGHDNHILTWETETGKEVNRYDVTGYPIVRMAYAPNGNLLALGTNNGTVLILDPNKMQFLRQLNGHLDWVRSLAFAHDSTTLASAGSDSIVRVWNASTGEEIRTCYGHRDRITGLAFGAKSLQLISTGRDHAALLWDIHHHPQCTTITPGFAENTALLPLPDASRVLVVNGQGGFHYLNVRTREFTPAVLPNDRANNDIVTCAAISPDGKTLALCSRMGGCMLVPLEQPSQTRLLADELRQGYCAAFSPDGKWLVVGRLSGEIVAYNTQDYAPPRTLARLRRAVLYLAFPPKDSSCFATTCSDGTVRAWATVTGEERWVAQHEEVELTRLAYSPDGRQLALGASDGVATIRDANTGKIVQRFRGHTKAINHLAFDTHGRRLITGADDFTVRLWDVETGMTTLTLRGHGRGINGVLMTDDDRTLVSLGRNQIKLWEAGPSRDEEDGRRLVLGTTLKDVRIQYDSNGYIRGTLQVRNTSGHTLAVPHSSRPIFGMRLHVAVERLGDDPNIPSFGRKPDEFDQYAMGWSRMLPSGKQMAPNEDCEIVVTAVARSWPAGKYRLHFEHSWPGEDRNSNGQTRAMFVIPPK